MFCDTANGDYSIDSLSLCSAQYSLCGQLIGAYEPNCANFQPVCGDVNRAGDVDIDDIVYLIQYVFGGVQILRRTRLKQTLQEVLSVAVNFQKQADFYQTDVGLYYYRDPLIFGLWDRGIPFVTTQPGDAIIGLVGIKTKQLHIGYSYDFTISNLITSTSGSHELSLVYEFNSFFLDSVEGSEPSCPSSDNHSFLSELLSYFPHSVRYSDF
jgi:hypothetical protein